jgi:hypothetical protein
MKQYIFFILSVATNYVIAETTPEKPACDHAPIKGFFYFQVKHNSSALPSQVDALNKEMQRLGHEMIMKIADLMIKNKAILAMNGKEPIMQYTCKWINSQPSMPN